MSREGSSWGDRSCKSVGIVRKVCPLGLARFVINLVLLVGVAAGGTGMGPIILRR